MFKVGDKVKTKEKLSIIFNSKYDGFDKNIDRTHFILGEVVTVVERVTVNPNVTHNLKSSIIYTIENEKGYTFVTDEIESLRIDKLKRILCLTGSANGCFSITNRYNKKYTLCC